ncbi:DUF3157 domain-containing protein [Photobacterium phosphoreum]|uniref:DUF3157 family protein n=1 Tax=Photobacterium phosphoreum TaxID=659 RepID=UPI000CF56C06|nr:DUF3157 family protein [Photobacterium phosphoreum]MCD9478478.1 DUF3157 family protein [Photobacterium phosphoreum]PQJ85787.1 hypothetical protein BTO21_13150 [Photobacterium phosphoreum]PSU36932.1 DUF3157 domain-containing protein [Photobacterium phosphoreum]PSU58503.1 DUF3157 domain-containing protein [Photobacterium phosphoreum]PSU76862.1 DUF3157 domain-containing protein [Photobacterium phosphoreum]
MLKKTQLCGIVITLIASSSAWAADQTITLKDGRQVILHDNFTWQYKAQTNHPTTSPTLKTTTAIPVIATSAMAIPVISASKGVAVEIGSKKAIQQLSNSGIDVLLTAAHYENGTLIIPTMMTNQSSKSVVNVTMKVRLSNSDGQTIATDEFTVWRSINRMPDTYFRPKTQHQGKPIIFDAPKAERYFIDAEITDVDMR